VIFVDTSFWVALARQRDSHHDEAKELWKDRPGALATTNHVVGETWTFLRRRSSHDVAVTTTEHLLSAPTLVIHRTDEPLEMEAWRWLRRHNEREYSFIDATSFALMRRLRMREVYAFDGDFTAAGFVEIRAPKS
jgi:predicted nucleic acid-binding protein